jgi:chitin disaccharide deacetylase
MRLLHLLLLALLWAAPLAAQGLTGRTIAQRLGYPADAKLLILHADDLGVAHSVNAASLEALDRGAISSASIMMNTPWVSEVAAYARAHPDADLGLHLVLTSEWETYRWGPVASRERVPTLFDSTSTLPRDVETVVRRAAPAEVERELRAQVELARALGIRPTHLDSHMGALFATPELFAAYARVARDHGLPFLAAPAMGAEPLLATLTDRDVVLDALIQAGPQVPREGWKQFYLDAVRDLKPGLTEIIVHLGRDDAELQAVMVNHDPWGSAWRQRDTDVLTSPEFKQALRENNVIVVRWRDIQKAMAAPR